MDTLADLIFYGSALGVLVAVARLMWLKRNSK